MQISRRAALIGLAAAVPLASATLATSADAATPSNSSGGEAASLAVTRGDGSVFQVQHWLNKTFGHINGWVHVKEDGATGPATVTGLVQATQSLLGITPVVAAFGPTTKQKLEEHGAVGGGGPHAETWRRLIQAGLVCKGFSSVALTGTLDTPTIAAVQVFRRDLSASYRGPLLSPHLFGALLTPDAVQLAPGGSPTIRTVQQYFNRTYGEASGGAYGTTNGLIDSSTYAAAIRAIQIASGSTAVDGAWGPGTAKVLRAASASVVGVGSTGPWVQLVTALLVLNRRRIVFDDTFTAADAAVVRTFQEFQGFPTSAQTGTCSFDTWAALAASSGDADRSTTGADMATRLDAPRAAAITNAGISVVGRYLTNNAAPGSLDKAMTVDEIAALGAAGLSFWPIFEEGGFQASWFTLAQGVTDAHRAHDAAIKLGIPSRTTVYFAVDFDATVQQMETRILPYFRGVAKGLSDRGGRFKAGVYGSRQVCAAVSNAGLAQFSFTAGMPTGWVGNQLQPLPANWAFDQIQARKVGAGTVITDIDAVVVSGRDRGVAAKHVTH